MDILKNKKGAEAPANDTDGDKVMHTASIKGPGIDQDITTGISKEGLPFLSIKCNVVHDARNGRDCANYTEEDSTGRFILELRHTTNYHVMIDFGYAEHTEILGLIEKGGKAYEVVGSGYGIYKLCEKGTKDERAILEYRDSYTYAVIRAEEEAVNSYRLDEDVTIEETRTIYYVDKIGSRKDIRAYISDRNYTSGSKLKDFDGLMKSFDKTDTEEVEVYRRYEYAWAANGLEDTSWLRNVNDSY